MSKASLPIRVGEWLMMALCAIALIGLATVHTTWQYQLWLALALFAATLFINRLTHARAATLSMIAISSFTSLRYAYWRATSTLGLGQGGHHTLDLVLALILFGAECYAWVVLYLGYLQTMWPLDRKPVCIRAQPARWPVVDVMIPTYNEPLDVVRPTVMAATMLDWPKDRLRIHLLDDGARDEMRELARSAGINYIARDEHNHAKAGNINHALRQTNGHYVAIFDCDHVPTRSFLQLTMGWFEKDPRLGLIQTPHHFYSPDPFERNLNLFRHVPNEGELFYGVVQDGNDLWDAAFFCGSCAIISREALDEIGGIAVETVTEDAHTSLRMQRRGWRSAYLNIPQAAGLATESLSAHVRQRIRWARGMAQIFRIDNPLKGRGLGFMQRLCYLNAMLHFFFALPRLVFLTAPLAYLFFGLRIINAYSYAIAAYALPHIIVASVVNSRIQGKHRYSFWNEVYEATLAPYILGPVLLAFINPKLGNFNVTAKGGLVEKTYFDSRISRPFLLLFALIACGIVFGIYRFAVWHQGSEPVMIMNLAWAAYSLISVGATLAVSWEKKQVRKKVRVPLSLPVSVSDECGRAIADGRTEDMSESGVRVRLDQPVTLEKKQPVWVEFHWNDEGHRLPATVIGASGGMLRLGFQDLGWDQMRSVVRLIYSRGDAWMGFGLGEREDKPFKSLLQIVGIALRGMGSVFRALGSASAAGIALVFLLSAFLSPGKAMASPSPTHRGFSEKIPLSSIGYPRGITLGRVTTEARMRVKTYGNRVVTQGKLVLRYRRKGGEAPPPRLRVTFNGETVYKGALPFTSARLGHVDIPINQLMIAPKNELRFELIGLDGCLRAAGAPALTILPTSSLVASGQRLHFANTLSSLPKPFMYPRDPRRENVNIVFAAPPDSRQIKAAGVIASWLGAMSGYQGVGFSVFGGRLPDGNAIVIGRKSSALMRSLIAEAGTGGSIREIDNPRDPFAKLLIITGEDDAGVLRAARHVAHAPFASTPSASALSPQAAVPVARHAGTAPDWASLERPWPFGRMHLESADKTWGSGDVRFGLRIPPSTEVSALPFVPVRLHYRYDLRGASGNGKLHLIVNGHPVGGQYVALSNHGGVADGSHEFRVASRYLNAFDNTIAAAFSLPKAAGEQCPASRRLGPWARVSPDSTVDLRGAKRLARLPSLSLWANGAFPFSAASGLSTTAFVVPDQATRGAIRSLLDIIGFIANQTARPESRFAIVPFSGIRQVSGKNLIVIGGVQAPMWRRLNRSLPIGVSRTPRPKNWIWRYAPKAIRALMRQNHGTGMMGLDGYLAQHPDTQALAQEVISPFDAKRVMLAIAPTRNAGWSRINATLVNPAMRSRIFANVTIIARSGVHSFRAGKTPLVLGSLSAYRRWSLYIAMYPSYMLAIVLGVSLIAGGLTANKLRRQAHSRLNP